MGTFQDLTGQRFGRLVVINQASSYIDKKGRKFVRWFCLCDCGNIIIVKADALRSGNTKSCGCLNKEIVVENNKKLKKRYNRYDLSNEYGIGYTFDNEAFYFDVDDYDKIKNYSWSIDTEGYVVSNKFNGKYYTTVKMHRLIMNCQDNKMVDHINHTKNDNRKNNLRIVTNQQNCMNRKLSSNNSSGCSGVHFDTKTSKWVARITYMNKEYYLGSFDNKDEAIKARRCAEIKYYGEYRSKF